MLTTSVHFEKILLNLELAKVQTGHIFDRFFGRDKLMSVQEQILIIFLLTYPVLEFLF